MKLEKVTERRKCSGDRIAGHRRRFEDACAAAHALDLLGERWTLLVVRELMLGPKRFSDLRSGLPGLSANVLTQRLEAMEEAGVAQRRKLPPPASAQVYELTAWGYEAEPILQALGRWAARSPHHDLTLPLGTTSLMLSMRTMFDAGRAAGLALRIGFRIGAESFLGEVKGGSLTLERAPEPLAADAILAGTPRAIAALLYGGVPLAALEADGTLVAEGDRAAVGRWIQLFPLPPKV